MWLDLRSLWERTEATIEPGAISLTGQSNTLNINLPLSAGSITFDGQALTMQLGTVVPLTAGAISIDGQSISFALSVNPTLGAISIAGQSLTPLLSLPLGNGDITVAGQSGALSLGLPLSVGTIDINGQSITLLLSGSLALSIDSPGSITLSGQSLTLDAPPQVSGVVPAGRKVRRRYIVEIDGRDFEVESVAHARALLEQAREVAARNAPIVAQRIATQRVQTNRPVHTPAPLIETDAEELRPLVKEARSAITAIYRKASIEAEIALRLQKKITEDDEDDDDILLLL